MKYIITQHYTIEHKELFELTNKINKTYAKKNGFDYISDNTKRCDSRKVWWEKIAWLIELLNKTEEDAYVVYMDCDSIILNNDLKLALHANFEYGMVQLRGGVNNSQLLNWFNAGVIILLNTQNVRDFLQRVYLRNDDTDETSINKELKSLNNTIGNSKQICSLDVEYNCWDNNTHLSNDICIKSWHGIDYNTKLKLIKEFIYQL